MSIRFLTAGESHGKALVGIIEGLPAGLSISQEAINLELKRRQGGYGRGGRMKIEADRAEILSGVRWGKTIGSPITLLVENRDWENWKEGMSAEAGSEGSIPPVTRPRPGHADLAGILKYGQDDIRNILERSSARETAMRVALGALCRMLLKEFDISIGSFVTCIGKEATAPFGFDARTLTGLFKNAEKSDVRCPDKKASEKMMALIDKAKKEGNSLGGAFAVFALNVPPGLGSHIQWDRRLDGRLAQAVMSIQAIKGVEVGLGFEAASMFGSDVMDEIFISKEKGSLMPFARKSNNAGGIEGGMSNGMPILLKAAMKPIPTQKNPLRSVDIVTGKAVSAAYERSDVCAVPAASVIGEAMTALVLADSMTEKFGGDSMGEIKRNFEGYMKAVRGI